MLINERYVKRHVKLGTSDLDGSVSLAYPESDRDRRLGIGWGNFWSVCTRSRADETKLMLRESAFWMYGMKRTKNTGFPLTRRMSSHSFRGVDPRRSRLNFAKPIRSLDTNVQFPGVETMDSRQCRHTWVNGMIHLVSTESSSNKHRTICEMISGGNLSTGRNECHKEGTSSKTSRAPVSRLLI